MIMLSRVLCVEVASKGWTAKILNAVTFQIKSLAEASASCLVNEQSGNDFLNRCLSPKITLSYCMDESDLCTIGNAFKESVQCTSCHATAEMQIVGQFKEQNHNEPSEEAFACLLNKCGRGLVQCKWPWNRPECRIWMGQVVQQHLLHPRPAGSPSPCCPAVYSTTPVLAAADELLHLHHCLASSDETCCCAPQHLRDTLCIMSMMSY